MKIAPITTSCGCQREKIHDLEFCDSVRLIGLWKIAAPLE
jgi:hypothetical protein